MKKVPFPRTAEDPSYAENNKARLILNLAAREPHRYSAEQVEAARRICNARSDYLARAQRASPKFTAERKRHDTALGGLRGRPALTAVQRAASLERRKVKQNDPVRYSLQQIAAHLAYLTDRGRLGDVHATRALHELHPTAAIVDTLTTRAAQGDSEALATLSEFAAKYSFL